MSAGIIDALLDNTNGIYSLLLTGGEPFIAVDTMRHLIDEIERRHIFLGHLDVVTNGSIRNDAVVDVLKDFSRYIRSCTRQDIPIQDLVHISVSADSFHTGDPQIALDWFRDNLSDHISVSYMRSGEVPIARGRAKDKPYAAPAGIDRLNKIEYIGPGHKPICRERKKFRSFFDGQITILCKLYITARGRIIDVGAARNTWDAIDQCEGICAIPVTSPDAIMSAIKKYNRCRPYCIEPLEPKSEPVLGKSPNFAEHPNPTAAAKYIASLLLPDDQEEYHRIFDAFGPDFLSVDEVMEYRGAFDMADLPPDIEESLKQNKMTADETRELLFKVLREKYGDYVRQTLATEQRIRQIAASMVHKGITKYVSDPTLQFALKMSPAGIRKNFEKSLNECRKITPDNIEKLTEEELAQVYVAIATNGKMPYDDERKIIEQKAQEYLHYLQ